MHVSYGITLYTLSYCFDIVGSKPLIVMYSYCMDVFF